MLKIFKRRRKFIREDNNDLDYTTVVSNWDDGESSSFFQSFLSSDLTSRSKDKLTKYWKVYSGEGLVFAAINTSAWNIAMSGFTLISQNEEDLAKVRKFISSIPFDSIIYENVIYALVFGDAFIEIIRNRAGEPISLKTVNPITMHIKYNDFGIKTGYYQKIGKKVISIPLEKIIHIGFYPIPGSPYHLSILEASWNTIRREIELNEMLLSAMKKHGTTKLHIKLSTVGERGIKGENVPSPSDLDKIAQRIHAMSGKSEIVTTDLIDIKPLDTKGIPEIENYFNFLVSQLVTGFMTPEEYLGLGTKSTEATAYVKSTNFERLIKSYQVNLAKTLETELFDRITGHKGSVKIVFKSVTDIDEAKKAEWIARIMTGLSDILKAREDEILTKHEVRHLLRELLSVLLPTQSVIIDELNNEREDEEV